MSQGLEPQELQPGAPGFSLWGWEDWSVCRAWHCQARGVRRATERAPGPRVCPTWARQQPETRGQSLAGGGARRSCRTHPGTPERGEGGFLLQVTQVDGVSKRVTASIPPAMTSLSPEGAEVVPQRTGPRCKYQNTQKALIEMMGRGSGKCTLDKGSERF